MDLDTVLYINSVGDPITIKTMLWIAATCVSALGLGVLIGWAKHR